MLKKYKKLPLILAGFAGVALLTTGFSAWVISGGNAESSQDMVSITVGGVTDNRPLVKAELTATEGELAFDSNADGGSGPITGDSDKEDMEFGGTVTFSVGKGNYDIKSVLDKVEFSLKFASDAGEFNDDYTNAVTNSYLLAPIDVGGKFELNKAAAGDWATTKTVSENYADNSSYLKHEFIVKPNSDGNTISVDFKFGYCWGSVFKHKNPVDISDDDNLNIDNVVSALNALQSLNGATNLFTLTVTPIGSVKPSA